MVTPCVGIRSHIQVILGWTYHYDSIKIATLKHGIELYWTFFIGIHSLKLDFFGILRSFFSEHLFLHLLVYKLLNLDGKCSRNFEAKS